MSDTHIPLNFNFTLIKPDYCFDGPKPFFVNNRLVYNNQYDAIPEEILTQEFLNVFQNVKIQIRRVIIFSYNEHRKANIFPHTDGHMNFNPALNLVISNGEHLVNWYKLKQDRKGKIVQTNFGEDVVIFNENDLDIIESTTDKGPYLFNTSIPHKGVMIKGYEEWTVSIRFHISKDETWQSFIERFKYYFA